MKKEECSKNEQAKKVVGIRKGGQLINAPWELGYFCPICHKKRPARFDKKLHFSEYDGMIWCEIHNIDILSMLCFRADTKEKVDWANKIFLEFIQEKRRKRK